MTPGKQYSAGHSVESQKMVFKGTEDCKSLTQETNPKEIAWASFTSSVMAGD